MINWGLFLLTTLALNNTQIAQQLKKILDEMYQQHQFETLILIDNEPHWSLYQSDLVKQYSNTILIPKIILSHDDVHLFNNSSNFNEKFLIITTLTARYNDKKLQILKKFLQQYPKTLNIKIIALMATLQTLPNNNELLEYFKFFKHQQLYDVLIVPIYQRSSLIDKYYSYTIKPAIKLVEVSFSSIQDSQYFPQQIVNIEQAPLFTYPDQLQPRTLLYNNDKGQLKMLGYIGRLITTYAQKINASVRFPFPVNVNNPIFFTDLLEMTLKGSLDIPASIACPNEVDAMKYFSRVIEVGKWFPMLPVADYVQPLEIYYTLLLYDLGLIFLLLLVVFTTILLLLEVLSNLKRSFRILILESLINQQVLLGLLGFSFKWPKFHLYYKSYKLFVVLVQFTGIMLSIFCNTYLTSSIATPPRHAEINTLSQLTQNNIKILMTQKADNLLNLYWGETFLNKYKSLIIFMENITEFMHLRNSFNKSNAYGLTSSLWSIYEKQQMYFTEKLFRYSPEVYFSNLMIYALPLPPNSIYEKSLNQFISDLLAAGILQHWYDSSFFDMIATGHISFKDMSQAHNYTPAKVKDFQLIWIACAFGLLLAGLIFFIESMVYKIKN